MAAFNAAEKAEKELVNVNYAFVVVIVVAVGLKG